MKGLMKEVSNHELAQNAEKSVEELDKSIVWNIMLGLKLNQKSNSEIQPETQAPWSSLSGMWSSSATVCFYDI